jgi:hypothetical protein
METARGITIFLSLPPRRDAMAMASIIWGKAMNVSINLMMVAYTLLPKNGEINPRVMPTAAAKPIATKPTINEVREPYIIRLRTSFPR